MAVITTDIKERAKVAALMEWARGNADTAQMLRAVEAALEAALTTEVEDGEAVLPRA